MQTYQGKPFQDRVVSGGPQEIPGRIQCAFYDFGGEGIAYHDADAVNHGSGALNPCDGSYLNEFRMDEGIDTSYVKGNGIDDHAYNFIQPELGQLYVGWTEPGEWINYSVEVKHTGLYSVSLVYTSNRGGEIAISVNGKDISGPIRIQATYREEDPVAWRQWHHWNKLNRIAKIFLEKGPAVLTLHILSEGNMNYAFLDFDLPTG